MLVLVIMIFFFFIMGFGVEGGFSGLMIEFKVVDFNFVKMFNFDSVLVGFWWVIFVIVVLYVLLGLLFYIGNKFWVFKSFV